MDESQDMKSEELESPGRRGKEGGDDGKKRAEHENE